MIFDIINIYIERELQLPCTECGSWLLGSIYENMHTKPHGDGNSYMLCKFGITIFVNWNKKHDWEENILEVAQEYLVMQIRNHSNHREMTFSGNSGCIRYTYTLKN